MAKHRDLTRYEIEASLDLMTADRLVQFLDRVVREKGAMTNSASLADGSFSQKAKKAAGIQDNVQGYPLAIGGVALFSVAAALREHGDSSANGAPLYVAGYLVDVGGLIALFNGGRRMVGPGHNRAITQTRLDRIEAQLNSRTNWFLGHHELPGLEELGWSGINLDKVETALDAAENMRSSAASRLTPPNTISMDAKTAYGIAADNVMAQASTGFGSQGLSLP